MWVRWPVRLPCRLDNCSQWHRLCTVCLGLLPQHHGRMSRYFEAPSIFELIFLTNIILVCELGCSECADSTAQCTTCKTGFTLDPTDKTKCDALPQTATGGVPCPDKSFSSNGVCTLCSSSCQTCTGPSSNDCVICAAGQYSFNGSCVSANTDGVCEGTNGLIADNNKHECDGQ